MQQILIENIPVEFSRKNIKNINIRISEPNGNIKVSAPLFVSMHDVNKFVISKKSWILKAQQQYIYKKKQIDNTQIMSSNKQFVTGDKIYIWGKEYVLECLFSTRWNLVLSRNAPRAIFFITKNCDVEKKKLFLQKWYKNTLLKEAKPLFEKWYKITGLYPNKVDVRFAKTVWGTCNKKTARIMLNGQLASMDAKYLDYVILHELTHLKYCNHGQNFKDYLTEHMPNWRNIRKSLNNFDMWC